MLALFYFSVAVYCFVVSCNRKRFPTVRTYIFEKVRKCSNLKTRAIFSGSNVIYKQVREDKTPFKKYNVDDIYYGRILKISTKEIKLDILCDRKAYLNTCDFFQKSSFEKYIFCILKLYNIIKVKITKIDWLHKKIFVSVQKYNNEEIYFSFKKKNTALNATVLDIFENYVLLYIAPNVHARLISPRKEITDTYQIGSSVLVQVDWLDQKENELYVKPYLR